MSPYQKHKDKWKDCQRCELWKGRRKIVLCRGTLPCDVLFIGEAPGESEDMLGVPFIGPAGKRQDQIIKEAFAGLDVTHALSNLVACFPKEQKAEGVNEPPKEAIKACSGRLNELVLLASPKLIVRVGNLSQKNFSWKGPTCDVIHPAAIIRATAAQQGLLIRKSIVTIRTATLELGVNHAIVGEQG